MISNAIFMGVLIGFLVTAITLGALFIAVVTWILGNLFVGEISQIIKEIREEPRLTRAERKMQNLEWEAFLEDLKIDHYKQPINVFRDGVSLV